MNNQFFGDKRDFYKYALLRILADGGKMPVSVCWLLTSCGRKGGGELAYLRNGKNKDKDEELFNFLYKCVCVRNCRDINEVEKHKIIPRAKFFACEFPADNAKRQKYWDKFVKECGGGELLFFDPDTGIMPDNPGNSADEYIRMDEIKKIWERCEKSSLMIFQYYRMHFDTEQTKARHGKIKRQLGEIGGQARVICRYNHPVAYYFLIRKNHEKSLINKIDRAAEKLGFYKHD